jgi:DNA-binding response OmpR family regulator
VTKILVVDDEPQIREAIERSLVARGYTVELAGDGAVALDLAAAAPPDLVVLDLNMPVLDGLGFCRRIRTWSSVPIIVLSVRDEEPDKIAALDLGADDYLTKPFAFAELLARLHALLRRSELTRPVLLTVGDLTLDPKSHVVTRGGAPISLTPREYAILETLMRRAGEVVSRVHLGESVWESDLDSLTNLVDVHISHLRRKVDRSGAPPLIHTVRGYGYRLGPPS